MNHGDILVASSLSEDQLRVTALELACRHEETKSETVARAEAYAKFLGLS